MAFRITACIGVLALGTILADPAKGAAGNETLPPYDAATAMDFAAVIVEVREVPKEKPLAGVSLVVKTDSDATMSVYLAPDDFFKSFEISFRKGDRIHIIGSKVKFEGETLVLAREVRRESATIYLRDRNGQPYWLVAGRPSS